MAHFSRSYNQALEGKVTKVLRAIASDEARVNGSNKTSKVKAFKLGAERNAPKFDLNNLTK